MAKAKTCFIISQIGEPGSPERKRSDDVLKMHRRACREEPGVRYAQASGPYNETRYHQRRGFEQLLHAGLVIADLSGQNPNVFYELAVRHMLKKPFVQLIEKGQPLPFDIAHERTLHYTLQIDDVERVKKELQDMVMATEGDPNGCETILSKTIAFSVGSNDVEVQKGILTEILSRLQEIQEAVAPALGQGGWRAIPQSSLYYGGYQSMAEAVKPRYTPGTKGPRTR